MSRPKIDVDQVRRDLDALVELEDAEDPRVKRGLPGRYLERGEPCCLVAHLLFREGISTGMLRRMDHTGSGPANKGGGTPLAATTLPIRHRYTPLAWELLIYLQGCNDSGLTWRESREQAWTLDGYWLRVNPKFANKDNPWCTEENALRITGR